MSTPGAGSRTLSGVERHGKRVTGMRQIPATSLIAAAVVIAMAITAPAFARVNTGGAGNISGTNSGGPHQPSYSATRTPNANVSGAHHVAGAGSSRQFTSSRAGEDWRSSSTPPGWTGHGEKRGWDGGKMPPGLTHRDHDSQWDNRKFDRRAERGDHERAQFDSSQFGRR